MSSSICCSEVLIVIYNDNRFCFYHINEGTMALAIPMSE